VFPSPASFCTPVLCARSPDAKQSRVSCGEELTATIDAEADLRADALLETLTLEAARARRWRYAWAGINGLSTVAPLAAMPFVHRDIWPDLLAGSIASAVSTGFTVLWPLEVERAPNDVPSSSKLGGCGRLHAVEAATDSASADEVSRRAWPWHVVNFGVSAALGAVLAFGLDHPGGGLIAGLSGFAVGEAQLFTQPVNLRDLQPATSFVLHPVWFAFPMPAVAGVGAIFEWPLP